MLVHWAPEDLVGRLDDMLEVYGEAMGYPPYVAEGRRGFVVSHAHRAGFRAVATTAADDKLLGFAYGYTSAPGQWWHEQVRAAMDAATYRAWMTDCFELVELHVRPSAQGRGIGHRQLVALLDTAAEGTVLLSTPEAPEDTSRAWRLYRRTGFVDLLRDFQFPGDDREFAILGRRLPIEDAGV